MEVLARWESRGGKYWVEAIKHADSSFGFRSNGSCGSGYRTAHDAIERAALEASFMPSIMRRIERAYS